MTDKAKPATDEAIDVLRLQISARPDGTDAEAAVLHSLIARIDVEKARADAVLKADITAATINALPDGMREYIYRLECDADPAGTIREAFAQGENCKALGSRLEDSLAVSRSWRENLVEKKDECIELRALLKRERLNADRNEASASRSNIARVHAHRAILALIRLRGMQHGYKATVLEDDAGYFTVDTNLNENTVEVLIDRGEAGK